MAGLRIIVADDDRITRSVLASILEGAGMDVVAEASDGAEVVKLCTQFRPDVLFLDINMPRLDGFAALGTIRVALPRLPVVMLSASSTLENVRESMKLGVSSFIVKPFTPEKVLNAIKSVRKAQPAPASKA